MAVILVEGASDKAALEVVAARRGDRIPAPLTGVLDAALADCGV
jgi:hypothetical protein